MKVSAKTEYACLAMIQLAAGYETGAPVRTSQIAQQHDIPARFLVQILLQLKAAGLVTSVRGAAGGYRLAKPPEEISLAAVVSGVEGSGPLAAEEAAAGSPSARVLREAFREIAARERAMLEATSIAELRERARRHGAPMYYI